MALMMQCNVIKEDMTGQQLLLSKQGHKFGRKGLVLNYENSDLT